MIRSLLFPLLLVGCSPLSQDTMRAIADAAKGRSSCYLIGGGAGALSVIPGPGIPAGGGYGYAWIGHAVPGQSVIITGEGCAILDGARVGATALDVRDVPRLPEIGITTSDLRQWMTPPRVEGR